MAQFIWYHSFDQDAPSLTGTDGSLINVLDACLVNGYGTGTKAKPGAGWTKPFANTTTDGCYRQGIGSMLYLYINDGPTGSGAQFATNTSATGAEARINGFETMSAVNVGANPFPTASQGAGGSISSSFLVVRKSNSVNVTQSREWNVFADSRSFYMFVLTGDAANTHYGFSFGDFYSVTGSDAYNCMIIGRNLGSSSAAANERLDVLNVLGTNTAGHFLARSYIQTGSSFAASVHGDGIKGSQTTLLGSISQKFNGADNSMYLSPVWISEISLTIRGRMRGFYQLLHPIASVNNYEFYSGSLGKVYRIIKQSGNAGVYCIEISDTLETN